MAVMMSAGRYARLVSEQIDRWVKFPATHDTGGKAMMKRYHLLVLIGLALSATTVCWAQDATIINARIAIGDGPVIEHGSIVVRDGKIVTVTPGRPAQLAGTVIDATGMTAVPGFIDGHKHLNTSPLGEKEQMADLIDNGFTTVLSALGPAQSNLALIKQLDAGAINGPRIIASGRVNLHGTPEQARAAIRALAAQGIHFTGEMPVTPEPGPSAAELAVLRAAVDEGAKDGVQVVVHAVSTPAMVAATEAGVRHEVHLPNKDFMSYGDAQKIVKSGTIVLDLISFGAPLINVFEQDDLPRFRNGLPWPESIAGANRDAQGRATGTEAAYTLINARRIWDASGGRNLGFGSDQNYPVHDVLEHELKSLMVMFSMQDVLRILGPNTAGFIGMQDQIGTLEPRKRADIVLVEGNPFKDFHDLLKTEVVLKDGKIVVDKRAAQSRELAIAATSSPPAVSGNLVGALTAQVARPGQAPVMSCQSLASLRLPQATITSAKAVAAGPFHPPGAPAVPGERGEHSARGARGAPGGPTLDLPAHCEVTAVLKPSRDSNIRLTLWLPASGWNARFMMVGNDGWGGSIAYAEMLEPLRHGFAVTSTDTGHQGLGGTFASRHPQRLVDFAYRAVHETAVKAKAITSAYYGGTPRYSYWSGGSSGGGRQGLKEVQMYPADFDGVIVGAPANDWMRLQARLRAASTANQPRGARAPILGAAQLAILHQGVLDHCDAQDGLKDGQVQDPRACDFSATSLICRPGQDTATCLTSAQADVADEIYAPVRDPQTHALIAAGLPPGSESFWGPIVSQRARAAQRADVGIAATSSDLSAFEARGGKIIQYHGWADPVVPAGNSINYYESVVAKQGGMQQTQSFYRLFLIPAMGHFGESYTVNWITPLEEWVERDQAPDVVLAKHIPLPGVTPTPPPPGALVFEPEYGVRPMCAYPKVARLQGGKGEVPIDWLCLSGPRGARPADKAAPGQP